MKTAAMLLLCCLPAYTQSPDAIKYAPRQLLLVDPTPGTEAVLPMLVAADGAQRLEFIPVHQIKETIDKGGRPVTLGDVLSLLGAATEKVNNLQAENDKLWKVAMKDAQTVVVQQSPSAQDQFAAQQAAAAEAANARHQRALQMWMVLNSNRPQPYQLPMPTNPNANRLQTACTTYKLGDMTHTTCN
jgi:hypothetical protein